MKRLFVIFTLAMLALAPLATTQARALIAAVEIKTAVFAGGCFWCVEAEFDQKDGVIDVSSGYMGGSVENATYFQVSSGETGHIEVVQVKYNPQIISYEDLLKIFWRNVDPTDPAGQFCDKGSQYAAGIFYFDAHQKKVAEKSIEDIEKKMEVKVATFLREAMPFYPAEEYHQEYYKKNELAYRLYKNGCGRQDRLDAFWGKAEAK